MIPPAIITVNNDLSESAQAALVRQLYLNEVISGAEFDSRVAADSEYIAKVKQLNIRIMVVRTFVNRGSVSSWTDADIVIFVKNGLACVEVNKFGPPGLTLPVVRLTWGALGIYS